jgi:hypothetical protein
MEGKMKAWIVTLTPEGSNRARDLAWAYDSDGLAILQYLYHHPKGSTALSDVRDAFKEHSSEYIDSVLRIQRDEGYVTIQPMPEYLEVF